MNESVLHPCFWKRRPVGTPVRAGLRRSCSVAFAVLLAVAMSGMGLAQEHDHEHDAPADTDNGLNLREQLVLTTEQAREGLNVTVDAIWATPAYFRYGDDMAFQDDASAATEEWAPAEHAVFVIDETTHTDLLPDGSAAEGVELVVDGKIFQPDRVRAGQADEHHRTTIVRFDVSPYQETDVTLRLAGGDELTWEAAEWFGVSDHERVIEVTAKDDGFAPSQMTVQAGEPVVFLFQNETDLEHHFHILDLEPEGLRWFLMTTQELSSFDPALLETAERITGHMCTSETGICRLATNVHLHANPKAFDAVGFVAPTPGRYDVVCPLHPNMTAELVVQ